MPQTHSIMITIAGLTIELESPLSASELGIIKQLGPFFSKPEYPFGADVLLQWIENGTLSEPAAGDLIYDPGTIWKMYFDGTSYHAFINYADSRSSSPLSSSACSILTADPKWHHLRLAEKPDGSGWQSRLALGAGELIMRTAILFSGGVVVHAGGLDDNGRGIVFMGHSGAGKSTQVQHWKEEPGVIVMNDDRIALRPGTDGFICCGTPWGGTTGIAVNHSASLSALILLEQADANQIRQIDPAAAASMVLARTFLPYWDARLMDLAMRNLDKLLTNVPIYRLGCRPEKEVVALVRSVL